MSDLKDLEYAVAIRDGEDLWLHKRIKRNQKGDIFVLWPFGREPEEGAAHATYHANGRLHIKTGNKKNSSSMPVKPKCCQKPDAGFRRYQGILMTPISLIETRSWDTRCDPKEFDAVFEILSSDLITENCLGDFQLDVTVVEAGQTALVLEAFKGPSHTRFKYLEFTHRVPWIVASICKTS